MGDEKTIELAIKEKGYTIRDSVIFAGEGEIGKINGNSVEVVYRAFWLPEEVEAQISLVEDLKNLEISYTEVLDRKSMQDLCGVRSAKGDLKDQMIFHARRLLSLAERVDDFKFTG